MHVYLELELYIIKVAFSVSCTKHGNVTFLAFTRMAIQRVIPAFLVSISFSEQGRFPFQYLMFLCSIAMEKVHWECQTCRKIPCFYSQFRVTSSQNFCLLSSSQLIIFVLKFSHVASRIMLVTDTLGSIVTCGSLIRREVFVYEQLGIFNQIYCIYFGTVALLTIVRKCFIFMLYAIIYTIPCIWFMQVMWSSA